MTTQHSTTTNKTQDEAVDRAIRESDAAFAIKKLGDLVRLSHDGNAGFEGMDREHFVAIGIAIQQLGERLYSGSISNNLEHVFDAEEA